VYRTSTKPLVDFYRTRPTFRSVNGAQPPDRVAVDLARAIADARNGGGPSTAGAAGVVEGIR
jgi:hypothetical protein